MRTNLLKSLTAFAALFICVTASAQPELAGYAHLFSTPKHYVAAYTPTAPEIDGNINDPQWAKAEWTAYFEDIEGDAKPKPYYNTRMKMLWDDTYLYLAVDIEDPHVWANLRNRDDIIYYDNDFEVFIDPDNDGHFYYEIEINALNTIFDLIMPKPYRNGSAAFWGWDTPGMKHAVHIYGSMNKSDDTDHGWSVEMAIPYSAVSLGNGARIPKDGEMWRINFSRVQWQTDIIDGKYVKKKDAQGKDLPEHNWVWSPQGIINMHAPERWGYLQFSKNEVGTTLPEFKLPYSEKQRNYLWLVYHKQKEYFHKNKKYASTFAELGLKDLKNQKIGIDGIVNTITIYATPYQFTAVINAPGHAAISINDEGLVR